ncbi:MAG: ERF family protein [Cyanobacteria bacterium REEB494]|nr:ERF family protein [Cyanobacteria bacterium REEB494]
MLNILTSLLVAKKSIKPIVKKQYSAYGDFSYFTYSDILEAVEPVLLENGLLITFTSNGTTLTATLWHVASGEMLESAYDLTVFMETSHKKMNKAQLVGSATTYAKKIALCGLLNLDTQEADPDSLGDETPTVNTSTTTHKKVPVGQPLVTPPRKPQKFHAVGQEQQATKTEVTASTETPVTTLQEPVPDAPPKPMDVISKEQLATLSTTIQQLGIPKGKALAIARNVCGEHLYNASYIRQPFFNLVMTALTKVAA